MNPYCNKIMSVILGYTLLMQPLSAASATPENSYFQSFCNVIKAMPIIRTFYKERQYQLDQQIVRQATRIEQAMLTRQQQEKQSLMDQVLQNCEQTVTEQLQAGRDKDSEWRQQHRPRVTHFINTHLQSEENRELAEKLEKYTEHRDSNQKKNHDMLNKNRESLSSVRNCFTQNPQTFCDTFYEHSTLKRRHAQERAAQQAKLKAAQNRLAIPFEKHPYQR